MADEYPVKRPRGRPRKVAETVAPEGMLTVRLLRNWFRESDEKVPRGSIEDVEIGRARRLIAAGIAEAVQ